MKKYLNFRALVLLSMAISLMLPFNSCDKEIEDNRPVLPPVESMVMDFSDFDEQPGGSKAAIASHENFLHSYFSVLFWNVASAGILALPLTAYGAALQQVPDYLGDNTWEWDFDFPLNGVNYTATLTGVRISNEEFSMEMVIGLALAPKLGVKWFDGVVRYDHTHATWNLYMDGKDGSIKILEAEWNKDFETEEADLTYTYMEPGQAETGSYIMLSYMPQEFYDAAYTISLVASETVIQWNTTTKEGHVKDSVKFENFEWHCWDTEAMGLFDKECD